MHAGTRLTRFMVCIAVVLLAVQSARGEPSPLKEAWRHYQVLEYDQALACLSDARRATRAPGELAEIFMLESFVQVALDRPDDALLAMRQALRHDHAHRPPSDISPKLRMVFDEARTLEESRARARAQVHARLVPPPAPEVAARAVDVEVIVEHAFLGLTGRVSVTDSRVRVAMSAPLVAQAAGRWIAHLPASLMVPGTSFSITAELLHEGEVIARDPATPAAGVTLVTPQHSAALWIESPMVGALVRIDGVAIGHVPFAGPVPVAVGRRRVEIESPQGTVSQALDLAAGEIGRVVLKVQRRARLPIARYTLLGLGGALLVAGGVLIDQSARARDQYARFAVHDEVSGLPTTDYALAASAQASARAFQIAGIATLALGGAAALVGAGLFGVHTKDSSSRAVARVALAGDRLEVQF